MHLQHINQRENVPYVLVDLKIHLFSFSKKWANPGFFFVYFGLFKQTIQFLQQIKVKKCPSSLWRWDSNPQHLKHELSPINTRPTWPIL